MVVERDVRVRSCIKIAEFHRSMVSMSFRKRLDGRDLSIELLIEKWGDFFHLVLHVLRSEVDWSWRMAEMLLGIGVFQRNDGRQRVTLDEPSAACLANSSALSLGAKSWWPGVQWICRSVVGGNFSLSFSVSVWIWLRRCWPGWDLWLLSALIAAWLSVPIMICERICLGNAMRSWRARARPTSSPS